MSTLTIHASSTAASNPAALIRITPNRHDSKFCIGDESFSGASVLAFTGGEAVKMEYTPYQASTVSVVHKDTDDGVPVYVRTNGRKDGYYLCANLNSAKDTVIVDAHGNKYPVVNQADASHGQRLQVTSDGRFSVPALANIAQPDASDTFPRGYIESANGRKLALYNETGDSLSLVDGGVFPNQLQGTLTGAADLDVDTANPLENSGRKAYNAADVYAPLTVDVSAPATERLAYFTTANTAPCEVYADGGGKLVLTRKNVTPVYYNKLSNRLEADITSDVTVELV